MLQSELEKAIESPLTEAEYDTVNMVYMYFPFEDKTQIYALFRSCGYRFFQRLYPEAQRRAKQEEILRDCPTCQLVKELKKRDGVKKITVAPYEPYTIQIGNTCISKDGPMSVYLVED